MLQLTVAITRTLLLVALGVILAVSPVMSVKLAEVVENVEAVTVVLTT
jgi:hypothetical protein